MVFEVRRQDEVSRVLQHRCKPGGSELDQAELSKVAKIGVRICGGV